MTDRRRWQLLATLTVVWLVLVIMQVMTESEPEQAPLKFQSGHAAQTAQADAEEALRVKPLNARARQIAATPKKNIFGLPEQPRLSEKMSVRANVHKAPPPPASPQPVAVPAPPPQPSPEEVAAQAARREEERRLQQLRDQMAQYRYLGYLTQDGERRAFLGKGQEIYIIRLGDTLEGKFHVASIDGTTVKLRAAQATLETTIQLVKERTIGPS